MNFAVSETTPKLFDDSNMPADESLDSLLNMLSSNQDNFRLQLSRRLLKLSDNTTQLKELQQTLPLLVQLLHPIQESATSISGDKIEENPVELLEIRKSVQTALDRLMQKCGDKRQKRVNELLQQIRSFADQATQKESLKDGSAELVHPTQAICSLMKLSFDETYRRVVGQLGGVQAIAELLCVEHRMHPTSQAPESPLLYECISLRRYICMALTNLTFGDRECKSILCAQPRFLYSLLDQLEVDSEELLQVTASLLRNLSWRPAKAARTQLQQLDTAGRLMRATLRRSYRESILKCVLYALWNLSSSCVSSRRSICQVDGSLRFLLRLLRSECSSENSAGGVNANSLVDLDGVAGASATLAENAGALLRNLAPVVITQRRWRAQMRAEGGLLVLLRLLRASSLPLVAAVLGILWPLSSCALEARALRQVGALQMLRGLVWSRHVQIAAAARATLCNLLLNRCIEEGSLRPLDHCWPGEPGQNNAKLHQQSPVDERLTNELIASLGAELDQDSLQSHTLKQFTEISQRPFVSDLKPKFIQNESGNRLFEDTGLFASHESDWKALESVSTRRMSRSASSDVVRNNRLDPLIVTGPLTEFSATDDPSSSRNALSASLVSLRTYDRNLLNVAQLGLPLVDISQSVIGTTIAQQSIMDSVPDIQPSSSEPALFYSRLADEMQQRNSIIWNNNRRIWNNIRRMRAQSMEEEEDESMFDSSMFLSNNTVETELQQFHVEEDNDLRLIHFPINNILDKTDMSEGKSNLANQHPMENWLRQDRIVSAVDAAQQNLFHAYPVIIAGDSSEHLSKDGILEKPITSRSNSIIDVDLEPMINFHSRPVGPIVETEEIEEDVKRVLGTSAIDVTVLAACLNADDVIRQQSNKQSQTLIDSKMKKVDQSTDDDQISTHLQSMQTQSDRSQGHQSSTNTLVQLNSKSVPWQPQIKLRSNLTRSQTVPNLDQLFPNDFKCQINKSTPNLQIIFHFNDEDVFDNHHRKQDLTYELGRRPELDPQLTYTLLASPDDQTIVDSSVTLIAPVFKQHDDEVDDFDENTFQIPDLEPLEDVGISLIKGDNEEDLDCHPIDLLDGSELSDSISFVENTRPPAILNQLSSLSLLSDSGVSTHGSTSRPDSGSAVRSRIPQVKSRLPKPCKSSAPSGTSSKPMKVNLFRRRLSSQDQFQSPAESNGSDDFSDSCHTNTGDTFTIQRQSQTSLPMLEFINTSYTPIDHVNPPSAMDGLSALSSTYGSINSICSDLCDSLGSCSDVPANLPAPESSRISITNNEGNHPCNSENSTLIRRPQPIRKATIVRPVQRPSTLTQPQRTQIQNGFQTYRKSTSKTILNGTTSAVSNQTKHSSLPRFAANTIVSRVTSAPVSNTDTIVKRKTVSTSANSRFLQPGPLSTNELRNRPSQSKSAGEISSLQQSQTPNSKTITFVRSKPQSKIASLWKRTVSGQQQQQSNTPSKSTQKRPNENASRNNQTNSGGQSIGTGMLRSGTFEKLPTTNEEAVKASGSKSKVRPVDGARKTPCRQFN